MGGCRGRPNRRTLSVLTIQQIGPALFRGHARVVASGLSTRRPYGRPDEEDAAAGPIERDQSRIAIDDVRSHSRAGRLAHEVVQCACPADRDSASVDRGIEPRIVEGYLFGGIDDGVGTCAGTCGTSCRHSFVSRPICSPALSRITVRADCCGKARLRGSSAR